MDIKKDKQNSEADIMELGKFYFMNNKCDQALAEFKKVLEMNKNNAEAYYNIGLINETCKNISEAKEMYSKALNIKPDYKNARERLNKLIGLGLEDE